MHEFAQAWLAFVVDISLKSILLAGMAGLLLRMFRLRDTNLRHRVWTAVLIGMLTMPVLVCVTPAIPLPAWLTFAIPKASTEPHSIGDQPDHEPAANPAPIAMDAAGERPRIADSNSDPFGNSVINAQPHDARSAMHAPGSLVSQKSNPTADNIQIAEQTKVTARIASRVPLVLASLYFAVAIAFVVRLLVGLTLTQRLIGQAHEIRLLAPQRLPRRRGLRMLETGSVHVPATVGFFRPVVLLPMSWRQWSESKLQAVLAHELAHVRRADWLVITLAELNRALYWFHPVAWIVRRRLSELAEQNCDDAVLEADGNRTLYAGYLLEVASSLTSAGSRYRPPLQGVAMARKPNVETRIDAILDASRPLARRLSAIGLAALVACGAITILVTAAMRTSAEDKPKMPEAEMKMKSAEPRQAGKPDQAAGKEQPAASKQQNVKGRVLGPDGKPVAGATVYAAWAMMGREPTLTRTEDLIVAKSQSDADGTFELTFSQGHPVPGRISMGWHIAAFAAGFGPAWQRDVNVITNERANKPTTLTLTKSQAIDGRFVDLEGNPLAGINVRIYALHTYESEQAIVDWMADAKKKTPPQNLSDYFYPGTDQRNSPYPGAFPAPWADQLARGSLALPVDAATDRDGRIHFDGLGANQLAVLEIEGPLIATSRVQVVLREMEPIPAKPVESARELAAVYYGRRFQYVAGPTQPIVGKVTDAESGKPLPNLEVYLERLAGPLSVERDFLTTRTDEQGRYRLVGAPRGGGHFIEAAPTVEQPYFPTGKQLEISSGFDPITCDFALRRGRWILGKVIDQATNAPPATATVVEYLPLRDNKHAKDHPNYDPNVVLAAPAGRYHTSADGSFRVLAIPGAGILAAIAQEDNRISGPQIYVPLSKDQVPKHLVQANGYLKTYHPFIATEYNALKEVSIPESQNETSCDLQLSRGLSRRLKFVDTQGRPVTGVRVLGRRSAAILEKPANDSSVEIVGLRPNDERVVVLIQDERKIGKAVTVGPGDEMAVELEPCAIARGRVVNDDGKPVGKLTMNVTIVSTDNKGRRLLEATNGDDGRFEALLPTGMNCRIFHFDSKPVKFGVSAEFQPKPGAVFELGDLANGTKLKADQTDKMIVEPDEKAKPNAETPTPGTKAGSESLAMKHSTIHGRITGVDGKPAADVDVAVIGSRKGAERGGDLAPLGVVLAERRTASDGRYRIELDGISSKTHRYVNVIARTNGTALAWRKLNLNADVEESFNLQSEEMISGRLVDIEGQPAAGVNLHVSAIVARVADRARWPTEGVGLDGNFRPSRWPLAWPEPIVTDGEGRFAIHGVPREHGVNLGVEGSDRFAPQTIVLNSGMAEQRGERDGTYRSLIKNLKPGEEAVLPLAPAQLFTGTVRYEDTGEPAPLARLTVWSSQQKFGSSYGLPGTADEKGRYKISAHPGIRFGVIAYPPDAVPYLAREKNDISWEHGARSKVLDIVLPRGVLIQGKVLEEGSDSPIAGAAVQYHAEVAHNPRHSDDIVTGWRDIHVADKEGRFSIVVLPGPGRLLAHGPGDSYVLQETSEQELYKGTPGGRRHYAHVIEKISPEPNVPRPEIVIRLKRGATIRGELVDQQGNAAGRSEIFSRLHIDPSSLSWRGSGVEATGGRFELSGLAPNKDYPVHFLDAKRRLGATLIAKAGMPSPRIVLAPCGAAEMRFVDDKGKPIAKYEPFIQLVVTPGEQDYSEAMMKGDTLAADAESIWVVDPVNHPFIPDATDDEGRFKASALIPGATYRVATFSKHRFILSKEFNAVASQTINLGNIVVERRD